MSNDEIITLLIVAGAMLLIGLGLGGRIIKDSIESDCVYEKQIEVKSHKFKCELIGE